ncbi:hypothetical protein M8U40_22625, partial [Enterobacter hormaechei]
MISIPVVHQICLVRFGFPPFGFIAVKGVIVWSKPTFRFFFRIALIFLATEKLGNDSNLLIVFYVQIMPDDLVMQLHR